MTLGLLDAATVIRGDGTWTHGYEVDALSCGRIIQGTDLCTPITILDLSVTGTGYKVVPFGIEGHQNFRVVCAPEDADEALTEAMDAASDFVIAKNLWFGYIPDWPGVTEGMFLTSGSIATAATGTSTARTIADVLGAAFALHPDLEPILHLGLSAAADLQDNFLLSAADMPVVVSPAYPPLGVAVTGPIIVRLGSIETLTRIDESINREYIQGTRLAAFEFDPCLAVVSAAPE